MKLIQARIFSILFILLVSGCINAVAQQTAWRACSGCSAGTIATSPEPQTDGTYMMGIDGVEIYYYFNIVQPEDKASQLPVLYQMCITKVINRNNYAVQVTGVDLGQPAGIESYDPRRQAYWVAEIGLNLFDAGETQHNVPTGKKFYTYSYYGQYSDFMGEKSWGATLYSKDIRGFANMKVIPFGAAGKKGNTAATNKANNTTSTPPPVYRDPNSFDRKDEYKEGIARVMRDGKYGFVDQAGKIIAAPKYDDAGEFNSEGAVQVVLNKKWGVMDKSGQLTVPLVYDYVSMFYKGLAAANSKGKWGIIDKYNTVIIPLQYDGAQTFLGGYAAVRQNDKWGYINRAGKLMIPYQYDYAESFWDGQATVMQNGRKFKIDASGEEVGVKVFIYAFCDGMAAIDKHGKIGYIDHSGEIVIPLQYDAARGFSGGFGAVKLGNKWGFINKANKPITDFIFDEVHQDYINGSAWVKLNGREFFIDTRGQEILPYDKIYAFSEGLAVIEKQGKLGYADSSHRIVIEARYDGAWGFVNGYAHVRLGSKWGFIDKTGRLVTQIAYDDILSDFDNGRAKVKLGDREFYINTLGREVK